MKAVNVMIVLAMVTAGLANAVDVEQGVKVLASKMDVIYLKVSDDLVGGSISVFDDHGTKVMELMIEKKRVLVDFYTERPGDYVIYIENKGHVVELDYHKA
jgi:hypothetical protein